MDLRSKFSLRGINGTSGSIQRDFAIINANLNRQIGKIKDRTNKGLLLAAIDIRQDMNNSVPYIPLDYGNLRASFFIITKKSAKNENKAMEVRRAKFTKADTPKILAKLRAGHQEVLSQGETELAPHDIGVMLGFSAFYAAPVHEMVGANFQHGTGAKYFQAAVYRNFDKIIYTVAINARVRP